MVGSGSSAVLEAIFGAVFNPGDELIMMDPTYLMYISLARAMHITPAFVPVFEENNFAPTYENLERVYSKSKKVKAILVNSPTNPTGGVYTKKQMEEIAKFAMDKDILIISDEIYEYILYDGLKHISMASLGPDIAARTITVNGFSKAYAMTGLRVGYAAGDAALMRYVYNHHYFGHICTCVPSMYAALEGLSNPKTNKFITDQVVEYDRRRKLIVKRLNEIGFETKTPKGAFYAFARCGNFDEDSQRCTNNILDTAHVVAIPGSAFGPHGEGFIRFSYATAYEQIDEAMDRIEKTFKK
jgi:aminotransferase